MSDSNPGAASAASTPGPQFEAFDKIARLTRTCVITEKIDGTNAQIYIGEDGSFLTGSRNGWITPEKDNFGFARWAKENETELRKLGPGRHFGEWWGSGIQRRYDLKEKRFSLFNVGRWRDLIDAASLRSDPDGIPACVHVVPVLYEGVFSDQAVEFALDTLRREGSRASPGFMKPEGVIVFHSASRSLFKKTLEKDESPKGFVDDALKAPKKDL